MRHKKTIISAIVLMAAALPCLSNAQGSATQSAYYLGQNNAVMVVKFACVASAVDGSFPALAFDSTYLTALRGWHCYRAKTDPGATAPTANYDITVTEDGGDVFGGNLANRSATATEFAPPYVAGAVASGVGMVTMEDTWTVNITNNAVNSAIIDIYFFFIRP